MPPKCRPDVTAARAQTERMLKEADSAIRLVHGGAYEYTLGAPKKKRKSKQKPLTPVDQRSAQHCIARVKSAQLAFNAADKLTEPYERRDGYIRAAYQAGQALSCARVASVGTKLGTMPKPKVPKPKAPKKAKKS